MKVSIHFDARERGGGGDDQDNERLQEKINDVLEIQNQHNCTKSPW